MKKLIYLLVLLCSFMAVSCDDIFGSYDVDWAPVCIYIEAVDANGNDIISDVMPGMTLTYKGETYEVKGKEAVMTRAYFARLYGLYFQEGKMYSDDPNAGNRLIFGEIDGAADMDEDIVLTWPDGSTNTIHYHCSDHKEGKNPNCKRSWKLDGQKHEGSIFKFVK